MIIKNDSKLNDADLIDSWKKGNQQAFSVIYKTYVLQLIKLAVSKTNNREIAEELVQNSFVKLYEHKKAMETNTSIGAYLYVILKNQILNHYRKQLVHNKYEAHITKQPHFENNSIIEEIETRDLEVMINNTIGTLPTKCREVFILSRKEFLTNKEIAKKLNISENTVEQHIRKAIKRIRQSIDVVMKIILLFCLIR